MKLWGLRVQLGRGDSRRYMAGYFGAQDREQLTSPAAVAVALDWPIGGIRLW